MSPDLKCNWNEQVAPVLCGIRTSVNVLRRVVRCVELDLVDSKSSINPSVKASAASQRKSAQILADTSEALSMRL